MISNFVALYATTTRLVASLASCLLVYGIYKIFAFVYGELTSPLRDVPGPTNPSFLYGSFKQISESSNSMLEEGWINQYGPTIHFKAQLGSSRLMTTDLKATNYVLFNSNNYPKSEVFRRIIRELFGSGLLSVEGDEHKHLNPAFGPQHIRKLTGIFVEKAIELRDIWSREIAKHDDGVAPIECFSWVSRTTLDIIGLAGFDYKFNALSGDPEKNELMKAFSIIFNAAQQLRVIPVLKARYPALSFLPGPNDAARSKAAAVMNRIGTGLLKQSRDDKSSQRKDIFSVLAQANMEEKAHQMKDEDLMSQIPTFLITGHETPSVAITWALYALSQNKHAQTKLREEISNISTDNPTMDDLNGLPFMDAVVSETLRLYPPVPSIQREAKKDDCIPLSKPFTDKKGIVHNEIRIRKGQSVMIPIALINRDKSIWGEDAKEFRPERWADIPNAASSVPGVWANLLTFIGGPKACIGFRFSLVETKVLLFTIIRAFEIDLAVSPKDLGSESIGYRRPKLLTDPSNPKQMPLLVRPVRND